MDTMPAPGDFVIERVAESALFEVRREGTSTLLQYIFHSYDDAVAYATASASRRNARTFYKNDDAFHCLT